MYNPYYNIFRYNAPYYNTIRNYANQLPHYTPYVPTYTNNLIEDNVAAAYLATPDYLPTLNVLAEIPYSISNRFTVVPMLVVSENNMKTLANGQILAVNKKRPIMTVKVNEQQLQCTPAVRIILDEPIVVYSLKTSILFPSEIRILHGEYNIPINVGAVLAPVPQDTFVSTESPISLNVVYAIPTKPIQLDYVNNNNDVIVVPDNQAVVVETGSVNLLPPKNVTILNFPEKEAEPTLLVDEEDEELGRYIFIKRYS